MQNNFFQESMRMFANVPNWSNMSKNLQDVNCMEMVNGNIETVSAVGQLVARNVQSLARKSNEMIQENSTNVMNMYKHCASGVSPEQLVGKQQDLLKETFNNAVNYSKEALELGSRSVVEAMELFAKRANDNVNHMMNHGCCHKAEPAHAAAGDVKKK